jgi:hypothetical protein
MAALDAYSLGVGILTGLNALVKIAIETNAGRVANLARERLWLGTKVTQARS